MDMDTLNQGLQISLLGFSVVIVSLVILSLVMVGFSKFVNPQKPEQTESEQTSQESTVQSKESSVQEISEDELSPQVVAAISAAVSFVMSGSDGGFKITSIRPVNRPENSAWKLMGRQNQSN